MSPKTKSRSHSTPALLAYPQQESETVARASESMQGLLETPADYTHVVVAVTKNVITG